jgi:hypothetical protein
MRVAVVVALVALTSPGARALAVHFDCFFPAVPGDCREVETGFFSSMDFLQRSTREEADVVLVLRGVAVDGGARYSVIVQGQKDDGVTVSLHDRIPSAIPDDARLVRLVNALQRGITPALGLAATGTTRDGAVQLRVLSPRAQTIATARPDSSSTGWYARPTVSAKWAVDTTERLNLFGGGRLNHSDPVWRFSLDTFAGYNRVVQPEVAAEPFVATFLGYDGGIVHSLGAGFSLRFSMLMAHDTNDNQLWTTRSFVGAEWIRTPFLDADTSNFGLRYQLGGESVTFMRENIRGRMQESFLLHDATAFVSWHFDRVDLEASASFRSILDDLRFSRLSSGVACVWRITDELNVSLIGQAAYRNALINAPKAGASDPLERIFGGNFGALATSVDLQLAYTFGNALLDRQDRRWR